MQEPDVRLIGLTKRYGAAAVVDSVSLAVPPGHLVSLLGPSGCGKTTTLRMMAGLVRPDAGEILFRGRPVTDVPVHRRSVGMLFQNYALFPHMTVAGNVAFGLEMRLRDRKRTRALVAEALDMVQLGALAERYPHSLSGGQQQRVALARALVIEPTILLLDEPFGALDKKLREAMQIEMKELQERLRITTVMVTHDQEEALTLSDTVAVMRDGRIEQIGPPAEIYDRPVSRFVAQFIGASNFFEGEVVEHRGGRSLVRTPEGIRLLASGAGNDRVVTLSLRPEAIRLEAASEVDVPFAPDTAPGTIERVIYRGLMTEYHVALGGGANLISFRPNGERLAGLDVGSAVLASWSEGRGHIVRS